METKTQVKFGDESHIYGNEPIGINEITQIQSVQRTKEKRGGKCHKHKKVFKLKLGKCFKKEPSTVHTLFMSWMKLSRTPQGSWAQKHFCVPHSLIPYLEGIGFSLQELPQVPQGRFKQMPLTEGRGYGDKARAAKTPRCSLGRGSWLHLKGHT